jgi:Icc-related predicted phosphoesterase
LLHDNIDILLTHEPPYGILDRTYRKERVGSIVLRHAVESSPHKPKLWCCGHIHEARGAKSHMFGNSQQLTLVVNAANANSGKAKRVITGPVLIDVGEVQGKDVYGDNPVE